MILVAGATGVLGSEIVALLRERGESVRCLVRKSSAPEKVARLRALGTDLVEGDLKDKASLHLACQGARSVVSTVSTITTAKEGDSFSATDKDGTIALIDAAKSAGVEHFEFISFDTEQFPQTPLLDAKRAVEAHLKNSGLVYTILHPTLFMEAWLGSMLFADIAAGTAKIYGDGDRKLPYVAVADVAAVAVYALSSPAARNAVIPFRGDEVTQNEALKIFEEAFGKTLSRVEIPAEALEAQWSGAEDPFQKTFAGLMLGAARGFDQPVQPPPSELQLRTTTVRDFAKRQASA